jgi:hypothetical protein
MYKRELEKGRKINRMLGSTPFMVSSDSTDRGLVASDRRASYTQAQSPDKGGLN